ncbi:MAG: dihydroorotase [Armatimonadetes bacterium]|nr:dihydroorotase [Armatimonadota bacterium]
MSGVFDLLIKNGTVVSGSGRKQCDIAIRRGKIVAVGSFQPADAAEVIEASHLHVLPGVIDTQVHFREPGMEHKEDIESGTRAAVCGGVTTIFEMPNTKPATTTAEALRDKLDRASGRAWCHYAFFVGACAENIEQLDQLEQLPGTPGIKLFMGSSTGSLLVEQTDLVREVMKHGKRPMPVHSEDEARLRDRWHLVENGAHPREHFVWRDAETARMNTERLLQLVHETRRPTHVLHISTAEELPLLKEAKRNRLPVTCEVTPNHLTFNEEDYERIGSKVQMNPPVRTESTRLALWHAVKQGLFDVIGSDHAPHTEEEKAKPYPQSPSGMPGVQTLLPVMLDWFARGEIELEKVVQLTSENPAKLYQIKDKGFISPGMDADLVLVDLKGKQDVTRDWLESKCGWSPLEGRTLQGKITHTLVKGKAIVSDSTLVGEPSGEMVRFEGKDNELS